jgi:hypothetical protein
MGLWAEAFTLLLPVRDIHQYVVEQYTDLKEPLQISKPYSG